MLSGLKSPCLMCEDRSIKCHAECERYITYKEQLDKLNEAIKEDLAGEKQVNAFYMERSHKWKQQAKNVDRHGRTR